MAIKIHAIQGDEKRSVWWRMSRAMIGVKTVESYNQNDCWKMSADTP